MIKYYSNYGETRKIKLKNILNLVVIIVAVITLTSCGGGGGTSTSGNTSSGTSGNTSSGTSGNTQGNPSSVNTIELIPNEASAEINANNPVEVSKSQVLSQSQQEVVLAKGILVSIDRPLFIDEIYQGMIASILTNADDTVTVILRDAKDLSEIIDSFSMRVDTSESVISSTKTGASVQKLSLNKLSPYDKYNTKKMSYSLRNSKLENAEGKHEPVLRIDIPAGYKIPVPVRNSKVECNLDHEYLGLKDWDLECRATFDGNASKNVDLNESATKNAITLSTKGSSVEIGLGMAMELFVAIHKGDNNIMQFTLLESAYFESNLRMSISGELSQGWDKEIPLTKKINVNIPIYGKVVAVDVELQPYIVIGANGEITGKLEISSYTKREGGFKFKFDSEIDEENKLQVKQDEIKFHAEEIDESGINVHIDAKGGAYASAGIKMTPKVTLAEIMDIDIGDIRGFARVDTKIEGKVDIGVEVVNDEVRTNFDAKASLKVVTYPMIDYKLNIGIDPVGFDPISLYSQKKYKELYKGDEIVIFEWKEEICDINSEKVCVIVHYSASGAIQSEIPYVGGVVEGIVKIYYESGSLFMETPYVNGVKEGTSRAYSESGELIYEETYVKGVKVS